MQRVIPTSSPVAVLTKDSVRVQEGILKAFSTQNLILLAGGATARLAQAIAPHAQRIWIAAGPGNNGGDGLQAACQLHQRGIDVQVCLLATPEQLPMDAHAAWQRAVSLGVPITSQPDDRWLAQLTRQDLCIDALLGIGRSREPSPAMQAWIERLNQSAAPVLALDVPTGLDADSGQVWGGVPTGLNVVQADWTITLIAAKPGLFMGHGRDVCGEIWLDALTSACPKGTPPPTPDAWLNLETSPAQIAHASHKGSRGDVAIIGGEPMQLNGSGMTGAAILAAKAALHGGAGRVILSLLGATTENSAVPPDVMQRQLPQLDLKQLTVVAGCGGGQAIAPLLSDLLRHSARLVLDADGLNTVSNNTDLRALLRSRGDSPGQFPTVITPHPLEAGRLLDCNAHSVQQDRLRAAQSLCDQLQCTVLLKGSGSVIVSPGQTPRINTSGNGLLGTGGTGDVLAGLTGAHLAQGHSAHEAACAAAWQHGAAADAWPPREALTASRLASRLG